jgi:YNFM family putative membrane transporter
MSPPYLLSQALISLIFLIYLVGTFSSTFMGRMSDIMGKPKILSISIILMLAGVCFTLGTNLFLIIIGLSIFTFGFFGSHSIASSWVGELTTTFKAQATSLYLLAYYLGSSIVGTSGGVIWSQFAWGGVVTMVSLLIVIAMLLVTIIIFMTSQVERLNKHIDVNKNYRALKEQ